MAKLNTTTTAACIIKERKKGISNTKATGREGGRFIFFLKKVVCNYCYFDTESQVIIRFPYCKLKYSNELLRIRYCPNKHPCLCYQISNPFLIGETRTNKKKITPKM